MAAAPQLPTKKRKRKLNRFMKVQMHARETGKKHFVYTNANKKRTTYYRHRHTGKNSHLADYFSKRK